jgi:hypothetical protein
VRRGARKRPVFAVWGIFQNSVASLAADKTLVLISLCFASWVEVRRDKKMAVLNGKKVELKG